MLTTINFNTVIGLIGPTNLLFNYSFIFSKIKAIKSKYRSLIFIITDIYILINNLIKIFF